MGKSCCVYGCNTWTKKEKRERHPNITINVFRFPDEEDESNEYHRWVSVIGKINANFKVGRETVICSKHWPIAFEQYKSRYGKWRPVHPPSVFDGIPSSIVPPPPPPSRPTSRTSCHQRNTLPDELELFTRLDEFNFHSLKDVLLKNERSFSVNVICFSIQDSLMVQSTHYENGVPLFLLKIYEDLRFETFQLGIKCYVNTLTRNRVIKMDKWSKFEEALNFLSSREADNNKMIVLQEQFAAMAPQKIGHPIYSHKFIVRAFEYFATSRSLYNRLRVDYKLPSVQTLTRITSKVSKVDEGFFLKKVFSSVEEEQKLCFLLHDEVYVKKTLLYHGGTLFGRSVNDPASLATTVLGIMIVCLYGGPKFLSKVLPVTGLQSSFIEEVIEATNDAINHSGGKVIAIICDGSRVNQKFVYKTYKTVSGKPWLKDIFETFLMKNIVLKCL